MPYFYHTEYTNLVWFVYILLAILRLRISGFGTPFLLVQYNIDGDQRKAIKHEIYPWKWNHPEDVRVRLCILKYTILAVTREASVNWKHGEWYRCPTVKSSNTSRTDWPPL